MERKNGPFGDGRTPPLDAFGGGCIPPMTTSEVARGLSQGLSVERNLLNFLMKFDSRSNL
jgi:hypothetical protein